MKTLLSLSVLFAMSASLSLPPPAILSAPNNNPAYFNPQQQQLHQLQQQQQQQQQQLQWEARNKRQQQTEAATEATTITTATTVATSAAAAPITTVAPLNRPGEEEEDFEPTADGDEGKDNNNTASGKAVGDNVVDLHNQEFCVDVSTFGAVVFEATPREKCETIFEKKCEEKTEQVCDEVTEIQCEIVPYTECEMSMEATEYRSFEMVPLIYRKKECSEGMDTVQHTKMMPECRNVTKQNCITKWEEDADGNQVWAGNEACEPVTWRECKLVPRQVDFKVPKIDCTEGDEIPYTDCKEANKTQMTTKMTCQVKHTSSCKASPSTKCQSITYQECSEVPREECKTQEMMVPTQEKEHKKKCLLPDDGSLGSGSGASPAGAGTTPSSSAAPRAAKQLKSVSSHAKSTATVKQLPLERLAEEASNRNTRAFQGQVGQPRLQQQQQTGSRRNGQPTFIHQ